MERIELKNTLPQVFAQNNVVESGIWHQQVQFERGQVYLVQAASGTGKSSLCSYIYGYRHDYQGIICFDGRNIRQLSVSDWVGLRKSSLAMLFQELRLFPELTAFDNVYIKSSLTGYKSKRQLREWFDVLGLSDKMDVPVGRMSFGQQQRVAMMRALAQPFDFLIADEPVSHLDDANARVMAELMMQEVRARGAGVIVTSIGKHMELDYDKTFSL